MKKILYILSIIVFAVVLTSCSNKSDKYIGVWKNIGRKDVKLEIKQGGEQNTFLITLIKPDAWSDKPREEVFNGILEDGVLRASLPLMGATPIIIDDVGLHFNDGSSCKDCSLYKKNSK